MFTIINNFFRKRTGSKTLTENQKFKIEHVKPAKCIRCGRNTYVLLTDETCYRKLFSNNTVGPLLSRFKPRRFKTVASNGTVKKKVPLNMFPKK